MLPINLLRAHFLQYGTIEKLKLERCPRTGGSLGIARVVYDASEKHGKHRSLAVFVAEKANGHVLRGQTLSVQVDLTGKVFN
jgi:hypothetical protein